MTLVKVRLARKWYRVVTPTPLRPNLPPVLVLASEVLSSISTSIMLLVSFCVFLTRPRDRGHRLDEVLCIQVLTPLEPTVRCVQLRRTIKHLKSLNLHCSQHHIMRRQDLSAALLTNQCSFDSFLCSMFCSNARNELTIIEEDGLKVITASSIQKLCYFVNPCDITCHKR